MIHPDAAIHPKAYVEDCEIGARTAVRQFASVTGGTVLGEDCVVWPGVMLDGPHFGNRCRIASFVAMGPGFLIGDDCFIGPGVTFCNDRWPVASKKNFNVELLRSGVYTIRVGNGVGIGAGAVILPGVTIGDGALIAAQAVVSRHVPSRMLYIAKNDMRDIHPLDKTKRTVLCSAS